VTRDRLLNGVARARADRGLTQQEFAERVGLSRPALSAIETGQSVPSTALALRFAQLLGRRVEDLFRFEHAESKVEAELADPAGRALRGSRVALATVFGKRVAHVLGPDVPESSVVAADGLLEGDELVDGLPSTVKLLDDDGASGQTLVCAGCSPALGILTARASAGRDVRVLWLEATSESALDRLRRGHVHVAGAHLFDETTGEYNVPFVRRAMPERSLSVVELGRWEVGLVVPKGNRRKIQSIGDLARHGLRIVERDAGSGAQQLLRRLLAGAGIPLRSLRFAARAESHFAVARAVALGLADAGIAIPSAARALGQDFVPLAAERFDLIYDDRLAGDLRLERLLDALTSASFSNELGSLGGYDLADAGKLVARTRAA
jgi:molybdate-binding protein